MRKWIVSSSVASITFVLACALVPSGEFYAGKMQAHLTTALKGKLVFKRCAGSPDDDFTRGYEKMLADEFGIQTVNVSCHDKKALLCVTRMVVDNVEVLTTLAPCSLTPKTYPSSDPMMYGYHSVLEQEIDKAYGEGAYSKAAREYFSRYFVKEDQGLAR